MKSKLLKYGLLCAFIFCMQLISFAQIGPLLLDVTQLKNNREKIRAKDPIFLKAYQSLILDADEALKYGPVSVMEKNTIPPSGSKHDYMSLAPYHWPDPTKSDGLPYIRKDGQTNPEVKLYKDKDYLPELCSNVYKLAFVHYYSGDKKYLNHAIKLINVWFLDSATKMNPNMNFGQAIKGENTGRGAGLIDARHFIKVIDAIGLMNSEGAFPKQDLKLMQSWFLDFSSWMQTSKNGKDELSAKNNHGVWYDALRLSISLFNQQKVVAKNIIENAQLRLNNQMDENDRFPLEMARTTSLHYSVFVIDAFLKIAKMAKSADMDFWYYQGKSNHSLKAAVHEMVPYLLKEKKWDGPQIKPFDFGEGIGILDAASNKYACAKCKTFLDDYYNQQKYSHLLLTGNF